MNAGIFFYKTPTNTVPTLVTCCCVQPKFNAICRINSPPPVQFFSTFPFTGAGTAGAGVSSATSSFKFRIRAINGGERAQSKWQSQSHGPASAWDEMPLEILPNGKKAYLDEMDILTFLHPPTELIPLDPSSYNPAAYLWKKIGDVPEERRHRLLQLLNHSLISRAWEIAGTRYDDPKFANKNASNMLSNKDGEVPHELYNCRTSGGPFRIAWINSFKKILFCDGNGNTYGRFIGGSIVDQFANRISPLYFKVTQLKEVMSTEEPCDLAYEFGDGLLDLNEYPAGFPKPVKHPYPFSDEVVVYVRAIGPGVLVAQAWQEGTKIDQVPQKLCGEILMVKDYTVSTENY